jgi:hypothetical protein
MTEYTIRASSLGALFDCAHRWEGIHLLGMTSKRSGAAQLGTAIHASTAMFDSSRVDGLGFTAGDTADVLVDTIRRPEEPVDWSDVSQDKAEKIGLNLHMGYCTDWSPKYTFVAVERTIKAFPIKVGSVTINLTGTMDRARITSIAGGIGIADVKSGKRAVHADGTVSTKGHAAQIGVYELLAEAETGLPVSNESHIIGMNTGAPRIGIGKIGGARQMLIGKQGEHGLLEMAGGMLAAGIFPPNPRSTLCSPRYCPRWDSCRFHE